MIFKQCYSAENAWEPIKPQGLNAAQDFYDSLEGRICFVWCFHGVEHGLAASKLEGQPHIQTLSNGDRLASRGGKPITLPAR